MRIRQSLLQLYILWTGTQVPWKVQLLGAGVKRYWNNPRSRAVVDCGEMYRGDMREEIVVGNAWRKAGQPWKQGDTAKSHVGDGAITIASLPPHASIIS